MSIRVGIVGANPDRGWGSGAHLPALVGLPEYKVTAVATTRLENARRTAEKFSIPYALGSAEELASHPEVDVVVVPVRAAQHEKIFAAAFTHRKHLVSEWPLALDHVQAAGYADAADKAGIAHAVVLQAWHSPAARQILELVAQGRIGELESVTVVAGGQPMGGSRVHEDLVWTLDPAAGGDLLAIMVGHALALSEHLAGPLTEVVASTGHRYPQVTVEETGDIVPSTATTHVTACGSTENGVQAALTVYGGNGAPDGFRITLSGSAGTLTAGPGRAGVYPHWANWTITDANGDTVVTAEDGAAGNMTAYYRGIAPALAEGRPPSPSFHDAARLHRTLAAIETAARTGARQRV